MGSGSFLSISCKQKTNCKSSCEAELVAVDDCIGSVLRVRHFLLALGYKPAQSVIIFQDKRSAILLEQNGSLCLIDLCLHLKTLILLSIVVMCSFAAQMFI